MKVILSCTVPGAVCDWQALGFAGVYVSTVIAESLRCETMSCARMFPSDDVAI